MMEQRHTLTPMRAVPSSASRGFVIVHPEWGIYLGHCLGLGFWSKLDPVGQPAACTFATVDAAEKYMAGWNCGRPSDITFQPVTPDDGTYASIAACVAAGLEGWVDEYTPTANTRML